MGRSVDRRAARVDTDPIVMQRARTGASRRTACRAAGGSSAGRHRRDHQRRDAPARALGAVEIAARCLDVDGRRLETEQGRDRVTHRIEIRPRDAAGRRRRSGRRVAGDQPACPRRARTSSMSRRLRDALRGPGVRREEPAEVALPGGAEQGVGQRRAGRRRRRSDRPAAARRRSRSRRAGVAAPGRTGGCRARSRCASRVRSARPPPSRDRREASP